MSYRNYPFHQLRMAGLGGVAILALACKPAPTGGKQLALGTTYSCVLEHGGDVHCWGINELGQLGQGHVETLGNNELPKVAGPIDLGGPADSISAGHEHACAVRRDGEVVCWGMSYNGQLGYGHLNIVGNNERPSEVGTVEVGAKVRAVRAGYKNTCAITIDHELVCWGSNSFGQLGYGHTQQIGDDEVPASAGTVELGCAVLDVALVASNTCALLAGGEVRCWGRRGAPLGAGYDVGENIGDDELPLALAPVELGGPAKALTAGTSHFCALLESGEVVCWGANRAGQLGYGNLEDVGQTGTPAAAGPVAIGEAVVAISAGFSTSCAIGASGGLYCWGGGRRGYPDVVGLIGGELLPVDVGPIDLPGSVNGVGVGSGHTCALVGGEVYCWGHGWHGPLGYGDIEHVGIDTPPASRGPVQYRGGEGSGVEPIPDEFDRVVDATLHLSWAEPQLPAPLAVGERVRVIGTQWFAFDIDDGTVSRAFEVRAAADQTLIVAASREEARFTPRLPGMLKMVGVEPEDWLAPLQFEAVDRGLCPELVDEGDGMVGKRLSVDIHHPNYPSARLIDRSRGQVGGGYVVSVRELEYWTRYGEFYDAFSTYWVVAIRQDCAPDCGPVDVINSCEPPVANFDDAGMGFSSAKTPLDPAYDISCVILSNNLTQFGWRIGLDCVGLP